MIFGKHALDNRLAVDLYRPLEKGVIKGTFEGEGGTKDTEKKNLRAARTCFTTWSTSFTRAATKCSSALLVCRRSRPATTRPRSSKSRRKSLDAVMLVSEPFTVAYGMERMSDILVIDIGAGTTDLCRMHGTVPADEDEVTYPIAGDAVDAKLLELIQAKFPKAQITQNMCKQFKEQYGFVSDTKDKIEVMLPVDGNPEPHDITDVMKDACEILIPPIVEGIKSWSAASTRNSRNGCVTTSSCPVVAA